MFGLSTYRACQRAVAIFVTGPVANITKGAAIPGFDADLLCIFNVRLGYAEMATVELACLLGWTDSTQVSQTKEYL